MSRALTSPRQPQQARSRERVHRMLRAADHLLATEGFEALTMRRIADEAEVPVGSIYQFFPDKAAIVDQLARSYMDEFEALMGVLVERAQQGQWGDVADTVLDAFVAMYRAKPGYLAIWRGRHLSAALQQADDVNNALLADGLRRILVAQEGLRDDEDLARSCRVAVQVGDALLQLAFRLDRHGDPAVIAEAKRVLHLYLGELVRRHESMLERGSTR